MDQFTALHSLLVKLLVPYVDFAIWGPHHHRLLRKLKLQGLQMHAGGVLKELELVGPPNVEAWLECFRLLMTGLIGFKAVSLGTLMDYAEKIKSYASRYGDKTWAMLYQADVRCRHEHMERLRRKLDRDAATAAALGKTPAVPFSRDTPWEAVFAAACVDTEFWRHQFEEPAFLVLNRTGNLQDMVSGEAPVAHLAQTPGSSQPPAPRAGTDKRSSSFQLDERPQKVHRVVNSRYTHNRKNRPLCPDFQSGTCTASTNGLCPRDRRLAHQCDHCLDTTHGGDGCTAFPSQPSWAGGKGKKGKSKGKAAGKGRWWS